MAKGLTKAQRRALQQISESPNKSGAFWRDLGISPNTLTRLEDQGMISTVSFPVIGSGSAIVRSTWAVTEAGRAALQEQDK